MLKDDLISGRDRLASLGGSRAHNGPDLPASAVIALVKEADLLVAREASEGQGRYGLTRQVECLVADALPVLVFNVCVVSCWTKWFV